MKYFIRILISYLFVTAVVVSSYYYPTTPEHLKCMYGRQRKAGDDVTCYQFHGQKCAKGFFCKGGPYDSEGTCCLVNNPCYVGKPVSTNGNAMSCGWVGEKCPKGTYCQRDYHNNYGVCCPDMTKYFKCKYGRIMKDGLPMVCEHGNANMTCPPDSYCISLPGTYGVCCAASDPCSTGVPYGKDGNAVYCGHSDVGERCPKGYFCKIEIPGQHEICCPAEEPVKKVRCEIGRPLPYMTCSDKESKLCPKGYYCKTDPKDKSVSGCCQEPPPCPPMPGESTVTIFPPPINTQPTTTNTPTNSQPTTTTSMPTTNTPTTNTPTISVPTFVSTPATTPSTTQSTMRPTKRPKKKKPKGRKKSKGKKSRKSNKRGQKEPSGSNGPDWRQAWEKLLIIDWS